MFGAVAGQAEMVCHIGRLQAAQPIAHLVFGLLQSPLLAGLGLLF